jgi:hypothetical protein
MNFLKPIKWDVLSDFITYVNKLRVIFMSKPQNIYILKK